MDLDFCDITLIASNILLQREQQSLGVLGREDYAALDISLLQSGERSGEVNDKLRRRVRNDGQVGIVTLGYLLGQVDLNALFLKICHKSTFITDTKLIFLVCEYRHWG